MAGEGTGEGEIEAEHAAEPEGGVIEGELRTSGDRGEPKRSRALVKAAEVCFERLGS